MTDWDRVRYFRRAEFGYHGDVEPDELLVSMLDQARQMANIPFVINSGIRSPEQNASVGGVEESAHVTGHAVDIRAPTGRHRYLIAEACLAAGFRRMGLGRTFVHVDTDPEKPQEVLWLYG